MSRRPQQQTERHGSSVWIGNERENAKLSFIFATGKKRQMNPFNTLSFRDEVLGVAFLFCTQHLRLILKSSANARSLAKPLLGETYNGMMWPFLIETYFSE